jgi:hypothetical protein
MKIIVLIMIVASFSLVGCRSPVYSPPTTGNKTFDNQVINNNFDVVWNRTIKWFAINSVGVKVFEKDSGFIVAEGNYYGNALFDCGKYTGYRQKDLSVIGKFNVLVEKNNNESSVRLTLTGVGTFSSQRYPTQVKSCVSSDALENQFFKYLHEIDK